MSPEDKEDAFKVLTKIETLEDFEENKKIIVDLVLGEFKVFVDAMKSLTDGSMSPEEIETKITSIEGGREKLEQEMEKELERISKIPGAEEVVLSLRGEMTDQMGALAQEMAQTMAQLMGNLLGGAMGGMMSEMTDEMGFTEESYQSYELPEGETIAAFELVSSIDSLEEYKKKENELIDAMEKMYKEELKVAQELKGSDLPIEELKEKVHTLKSRQLYIINEMENDFSKLDSIPGIQEYMEKQDADGLTEKIAARMESTLDELMQTVNELEQKVIMASAEEPVEREVKYCPECEYAVDEHDNNKCSYCGYHLDDHYEGRVRSDLLGELYNMRSLDQLKELKDGFIEYFPEDLQDFIYTLEAIDSPDWINDSQEDVEKIDKKLKIIEKELEAQFARLKAMPDAAKDAEAFEKEVMEKIEPKLKEIKTHLERIHKDASWYNK